MTLPIVASNTVAEITRTSGTADYILAGPIAGCQDFADFFDDGETLFYEIGDGAQVEGGIGTYTAGVISRDTILYSTNSGNPVSWPTGGLRIIRAAVGFGDDSGSIPLGHVSAGTAGQVGQYAADGTTLSGATISGDATLAVGGALTIAGHAVSNAKLAQMAAHTFKGNNSGGTANAADLTATQLTAELNAVVGDTGSGGTKGLVPAPGSGDAAAFKFLKADGSWAVPTAAGSVTGSGLTSGAMIVGAGSSAIAASTKWSIAGDDLVGNLNTAAEPSNRIDGVHAVGADGENGGLQADSFAANSLILLRRANGTDASKSALATADAIGSFQVRGYGATDYSTSRAEVRCSAAEDWSDTAQGTYLDLYTTPNGSTTEVIALRCDHDGGILVPTSVTGGSKGPGSINAAALYVGGVAVGTGSGDFAGPGSSTSGDLVSFGDASGKLGADSGLAAANVMTASATLTSGGLILGAGSKTAAVSSVWNVAGNDLVGNLNAASAPANVLDGVQAVAADGSNAGIQADSFATNGLVLMRRANGTNASKSAVANGDALGAVQVRGYGATGYSTARAEVRFFASQDWTDAHQGTYLDLYTTGNDTTSEVVRLRVENDGGLTVPSSVTGGSKGAGTINAAGLYVNGAAVGTGSGDFVGPAGATSGNLVSFGSATGKLGADSTVAAANVVTASGTLTADALLVGGGTKAAAAASVWSVSATTLTGNFNSAAVPNAIFTDSLHIAGADTAAVAVQLDTFATLPIVVFRRANGTDASKSAISSGNSLGSIQVYGYRATAYSTSSRAEIAFGAAQTWTDAANGTFIDLMTTPNGTATEAVALRIENDGGITVPNNVTGGNKGAGTINSSGHHYVGGVDITPGALAATQSTPADPTGSTSYGTQVMMGLAGTITPLFTGRVLITVSGDCLTAAAGNGGTIQIRHGTGTAPANAAAATGTADGNAIDYVQVSNPVGRMPFTLTALVTGLSAGTAYWIDLGLASTSGTNAASVENVCITAVEL